MLFVMNFDKVNIENMKVQGIYMNNCLYVTVYIKQFMLYDF